MNHAENSKSKREQAQERLASALFRLEQAIETKKEQFANQKTISNEVRGELEEHIKQFNSFLKQSESKN